jgi:hypothetical protein
MSPLTLRDSASRSSAAASLVEARDMARARADLRHHLSSGVLRSKGRDWRIWSRRASGDGGGSRLVGLRLLKNESRCALRGDTGALQRGGVQGLE